jgi:hypothetical protein
MPSEDLVPLLPLILATVLGMFVYYILPCIMSSKMTNMSKISDITKQAGAELCQAQDQLGLPAEAKLIFEVVYNLGCAAEDI